MFELIKWSFSFLGHLAIWCVIYNHVHATAFPRKWRKGSEKLVLVFVLVPALWVLYHLVQMRTIEFHRFAEVSESAYWYGYACILIGIFFSARWLVRKLIDRRPAAIVFSTTETVDVEELVNESLISGSFQRILAGVPGNQVTEIAIEKKTFAVKGDPRLDGLRIAHLSDLHFTGQLSKSYFKEVVRQSNTFNADFVFVTGDLVDELDCIPWVPEILGGLTASIAKLYVRGNHDRRISDESHLLEAMQAASFIKLGDRWHTFNFKGAGIVIAGNELPWYSGAEELPVESPDETSLKILLSHSPDQLGWARGYQFDLMFAGHTHGGQIRLPVIGPIVAPSTYGVKYCGGTYQLENMLMHVSRGLSGDEQIRLNCPPELGLFQLNVDESQP